MDCTQCGQICCPSPDKCVIARDKVSRFSDLLFGLIFVDGVGALSRIFIFDFMTGLLFLLDCWIDYMGYATLSFCNMMIIALLGIMDCVILAMNFNRLETSSVFVKVIFWIIFAAAVCKTISGFVCYNKFKDLHIKTHGNLSMNPF